LLLLTISIRPTHASLLLPVRQPAALYRKRTEYIGYALLYYFKDAGEAPKKVLNVAKKKNIERPRIIPQEPFNGCYHFEK
jgi:hypothetical protein